jgi:hypothetical protein
MGFAKGSDGTARSVKQVKDPTQDTVGNITTIVNNLQSGAGFTFSGPFSNDAAANTGGVAIGQVYYNSSGGLVVRQT